MARLDRCTCGRMPVIRARRMEGQVSTQVTCASHECGAQGPEYWDEERNDAGAARLWNRMGGRRSQ